MILNQHGQPLTLEGFAPRGPAATRDNLEAACELAGNVIDALDEQALLQLCGGDTRDMEGMFTRILDQSYRVITERGQGAKVNSSAFGYLDKLAASLDEAYKCEDINYFISSTLPEFDLGWHHMEWGNLVMWYRLLNVIAARDHSKSKFFSYCYPLWKLYRYVKDTPLQKAPLKYKLSWEGCLFSSEMSLAQKFLSELKDEIEGNPMLRAKLYPEGLSKKSRKWNDRSITTANGARFYVKSYGSRARGLHPGWIVVDDFLTDASLFSADQRKKVNNFFFSVIMNMIVPKGQVVVVGTPFHEADLYGELKKRKRWRVFEYPALFPDGTVLYPRRHDFKGLMAKRDEQGSLIFSREILVKPITSDSTIFPYEMLRGNFDEEFCLAPNRYSTPKRFVRVVMGCDFAISANVGADYSVFITIGVDEAGKCWLLNIHREAGQSFAGQISRINALYANFQHDAIFMESNQMQQIFPQEAERMGLPVFPHHTGSNKYDFKLGLPGLAILFEKKRLVLPRGDEHSRNMTDILCSELSSIAYTDSGLQGVGTHDDTAMALWITTLAARHHDFGFTFL